MSESIPEFVAERAAVLWVRMLADPSYDYLGNTGTDKDKLNAAFAVSMIQAMPKNNTPDVLEKFGEALKAIILDESVDWHRRSYLEVDYDPNETLRKAAEEVGLEMQWPYKTSMSINRHDNSIGVRAGYGAETLYHYPMKDGRWLLTHLHGPDICKVIEYVECGQPEFRIEL